MPAWRHTTYPWGCWNRLHSTRTLEWIQKVATQMSWMIAILILLLLIIFIIALALVRMFVSQNQRTVITARFKEKSCETSAGNGCKKRTKSSKVAPSPIPYACTVATPCGGFRHLSLTAQEPI